MLLGHIVCKQGLLLDLANITLILSLPLPKNVNMLRETLGHTVYYCKFIRGYAAITAPMEKLLKKDVAFVWSPECQGKLQKDLDFVHIPMYTVLGLKPAYVHDKGFKSHV